MNRILNILLVTFIVMIGLNYLLPQPAVGPTIAPGVVSIQFASSEYSVPQIPVATVHNTTTGEIAFNTCRELRIFKDGSEISGIANVFPAFCQDVRIAPAGSGSLSLSPLAKVFYNPGAYVLNLKVGDKEAIAQVTETERGAIKTFFSAIVYAPVYNLFAFLIETLPGHSFGLAIILITIVVRIILLFPQHHVMVSSRRMQAIQPKVKELQEKHKGDQAAIGMKLMELYKTEGVNPLGSCLPLLIQMPILIVLYGVISNFSDPANSFHLYSMLSAFDPKNTSMDFYGLNLQSEGGVAGVILALLVGGFTWLQIKLSQANMVIPPKSKTLEKKEDGSLQDAMDPAMMNMMMLYMMPIMITISTYFFPAGLGIYWLVGSLFMIVQQYVANKIADRKKTKKPSVVIEG